MSLAQLTKMVGTAQSIRVDIPYVADPLLAFEAIDSQHSLLLESAEIDSKANLKSILLIDAAVRIECNANCVHVVAITPNGIPIIDFIQSRLSNFVERVNQQSVDLLFPTQSAELDEDTRLQQASVFDVLRTLQSELETIGDDPHRLFLGGVFAYDLLETFENLPAVPAGNNDCPEYVFYLAQSILVVDHQARSSHLLATVFSGADVAEQYFALSQRLEQLTQQLANLPKALRAAKKESNLEISCNMSDQQYCEHVSALKEHILDGDIFQVVPSRTFSLACPSPIAAYAKLKVQNPSPYMFFLRDPDFCMFGASPESALKYTQASNMVEVYPIAGTRPRGKNMDGSINPDLDSRLELSLRQDEKEKAEHIMLVDLARNDLARVCQPGTRHVSNLLQVDRYSHVMHLVSRVVGQLRLDLDALHAYQACMNMGTLVGAPKVSAAKLIREVEQSKRGSYGGAVGYLNANGDMDTCIVIRSAFVKNGLAHVQAGAGVVHDSVAQSEADETRAKAFAVLRAIETAHQPESERAK